MANVMLHKIDPVTGTIKRIYPDLERAEFSAVSSNLPNALTGKTLLVYKSGSQVIRGKKLLETPLEVDALNQMAKAISIQGQSTLIEATLEMVDGNVLDLAGAANAHDITSTKIVSAVFTNVATATTGSADAVRLLPADNNLIKVIKNPQTYNILVFPNAVGEFVNGGAGGAAYTLAPGATISFYTKKDGATTKKWFILS